MNRADFDAARATAPEWRRNALEYELEQKP
jgi:hypothetical protein